MSNLNYRYDITEASDDVSTNFFFFSKGKNGKEDVLKVVQFTYFRYYNGLPLHNFGFGDFNLDTVSINDRSMSDNGDVYRVFNTVLSTVPIFFEKYPNVGLMVTGSDGHDEYVNDCKQNCIKRCIDACLNFNRRMKIYCTYVSRMCSVLRVDYQILGGLSDGVGWFVFSEFEPGMLYDCIIVSRKCLNSIYEAR